MEEIYVNISISQWQIIHDAIFFKSLSSFYSLELENFLQFEIIDLCMNSLLKFIPLSLVVFFQKELKKCQIWLEALMNWISIKALGIDKFGVCTHNILWGKFRGIP